MLDRLSPQAPDALLALIDAPGGVVGVARAPGFDGGMLDWPTLARTAREP